MGSLRRSDDTGLALYVILRDASHYVVIESTGAVEVYNASHWSTYVHAATEQGASGYYTIATSSSIPAGVYWIEWKYQSGGSPAVSDTVRASGNAYWNGTSWYAATVDVGTIKAADANTAIQDDAAVAILVTPANKLATDEDGAVVSSNELVSNNIADALLDRASAIDGKTPRQALQIIAAVVAGKITTAGNDTEIFLGLDGITTRVTVATDVRGDRTSVTYA